MTAEAPPTETGDLRKVAGNYKHLKQRRGAPNAPEALAVAETTNAPAEAPEPAPEAPKPPQKQSRRQRAAARRLQEALEAERLDREAKAEKEKEEASMDVESIKDLERFKFRMWIAKLVMGSMVGLIMGLFLIYMYTALVSKTVPDMALFGTIFGHLKEVLVVIIEAQK